MDVENGGAQENVDGQGIEDIAHEDILQYTAAANNECELSKDLGYNSNPTDSTLDEPAIQRANFEPSNTEIYTHVSKKNDSILLNLIVKVRIYLI